MKNLYLSVVTGVLISLALNAAASTIIGQPQEAYELGLGEVTLPRSEGGSIIFKECRECRTQSLRTTGATAFVLEEQAMSLGELRRAVDDLKAAQGGSSGIAVYVFYNRDSKRVERLVVDVLK